MTAPRRLVLDATAPATVRDREAMLARVRDACAAAGAELGTPAESPEGVDLPFEVGRDALRAFAEAVCDPALGLRWSCAAESALRWVIARGPAEGPGLPSGMTVVAGTLKVSFPAP